MNAAARVPFRNGVDNSLSTIERRVYEICVLAAETGSALPTNEEINALIGSHSSTGATAASILRRLRTKGYIQHDIYQRGRQVTIIATGKQTAPPACLAPHWRLRKEAVPTPSLQLVRQEPKAASAQIEAEARKLGKAIPDFLGDLVYIGWHTYLGEQGSEA